MTPFSMPLVPWGVGGAKNLQLELIMMDEVLPLDFFSLCLLVAQSSKLNKGSQK